MSIAAQSVSHELTGSKVGKEGGLREAARECTKELGDQSNMEKVEDRETELVGFEL